MDYLVIIKTSKGYSHIYCQTPDRICENLNNIGDLQDFSVVGLPDPVEDLKGLREQIKDWLSKPIVELKSSQYEFDRGYAAAKQTMKNWGKSPKDTLDLSSGRTDFDKGWEAACMEAMMDEPLPLKNREKEFSKEFTRGYDYAKKAIGGGQKAADLLNQQRSCLKNKGEFDDGWTAACTEVLMGEASLPDLSLDGTKVKPREYEYGKWYKYQDLMAVFQGRGVSTYGKIGQGWLTKGLVDWDFSWEPAVASEIKSMLEAEARRRYTGEAIEVDGDVENFDPKAMYYDPTRNALAIGWLGNFLDLFRRGTWLEPAPKPKKTELFGIKNYTEEELLGFVDQISNELLKRRK